MKIKQKTMYAAITLLSVFGISFSMVQSVGAATCGGATTSIISCSQGKGAKGAQDTGVWALLLIALNILTAGVGIAAVGGVVYAAILYASSSDNAEQTKKAKDIIRNVAIGILAYASMYIVLNFIVPGGIFS